MIRHTTWWHNKVMNKTFRLREWSCCGIEFQLLLSSRYPKRENWNPTCPKCGLSTNMDS